MPRIARVSDIKANLLRPSTTSHFEVEIPLPSDSLFDKWKGVGKQDKIQLMCSEASLPGSNLATMDIFNDRTGVTEKHVHRRIFDDRLDLTFYVDAGLYQPIKFFEEWIDFITGAATESQRTEFVSAQDGRNDLVNPNYSYRMRYPDTYISDQGLVVRKFEKDLVNSLAYEFIRAFPLSIGSMPVSYESSSLLKCTVSLSYIRYTVRDLHKTLAYPTKPTPQQQSEINSDIFGAGFDDIA